MKRVFGILLTVVMVLSLAACGGNGGAEEPGAGNGGEGTEAASGTQNVGTSEKKRITLTYRDDGQGETSSTWKWFQAAYETYDKKDQVEINIAPITASEGDYFAKIALALQSEKTAPDIVTEDTFQLAPDASAGYLEPLDEYLKGYGAWTDGSYYESLKAGVTTSDGKVYGIPYNTDSRGLWYNKEIFKKAGLPEEWAPANWDEILDACRTIKQKVPEVVPIWFNSGVATGEATSMQTYEMLLYGTGERLIDEQTGKWVVKSQEILDSLNFIDTVYKEELGPPVSKVLNGQASNTSAREYLPQGKLAISLDGSWITGNYKENGASPWPEYEKVLGFAAMPTSRGQDPGTITLAGGWALSIPAKSQNKDIAFDFITHCMSKDILLEAILNMGSITTRTDVAADPRYSGQPFMSIATEFLAEADFRPKDDKYSNVSTQIQTMVESVVTGTSPADAMNKYAIDVARIVGDDNVIEK